MCCSEEALHDEDEMTMLLRKCGHKLYHGSGRGLRQDQILTMLDDFGSMTQTQLKERLGIQPGSASELISKLEIKGMITRTRDKEDKRCVTINLTADGKREVEIARRNRLPKDKYGHLTPKEQEELKELLKKLLDGWDKENEILRGEKRNE